MKISALETITTSHLSTVTGGNDFANMSTQQVVDRLKACSYQAYMRGRKDQDIGMAPEAGPGRAADACNVGIDAINTAERSR